MMKSPVFFAGLGLAAAAIAAPAQAQVSVFGNGVGRDCFLAVKEESTAFSRARDICDLALTEGRLSRRDRAATHINRGILYMREDQYGRAISDYERAIELRATLPEAYTNLGAALYSLGRLQEALDSLNRGVESEDPKARAIAFYNRGLVKERLDDPTAAYYDYRTAQELDPDFVQATEALSRFTVQVVSAS